MPLGIFISFAVLNSRLKKSKAAIHSETVASFIKVGEVSMTTITCHAVSHTRVYLTVYVLKCRHWQMVLKKQPSVMPITEAFLCRGTSVNLCPIALCEAH